MRDKPKILIIDDDPMVRELVKAALLDQGFEVATMESARLALTVVSKSKPDLILLDVYLPDETGLSVCRKLKADPATASIPVVLFTGSQDVIDQMTGTEAGAFEYIRKPIETEALAARLRQILDHHAR